MTIECVSSDKCSGCCLCENICPVNAITMCENEEGFIHPIVDHDKCIDCGKCFNRCPVNSPKFTNDKLPQCHAIIGKDEIRDGSATSGIFFGFAKKIIEENGIVYGAAYNEDFSVSFKGAQSLDELESLKNSKYVQANAGLVYKHIKEGLLAGKKVLLGACPCQIAAAYSYLEGLDITNFYTMDIVCHGVPSPKLYRKYLKEEYGDKEIDHIDFRDRTVYGWSSSVNVFFKDGTITRRSHIEDPFYQLFLPCVGLRRSCATCQFSKLPRQADLTIGDFWGIADYDKALFDGKGTSVVLVNNSKGHYILDVCEEFYVQNRIVPLSEALRINKTIEHPYPSHPGRKHLFSCIDNYTVRELADKCIHHKYDIGIVGLWYGLNYGSILTYYALYKLVNELGHDALMINKPQKLWNDRYIDRNSIANRFIYNHCNVSNIREDNEWQILSNQIKTFIVGSDVVWNYEICGNQSEHFFFLDWVRDDCKKIAMASSFGSGYHAPEEVRIYDKFYLNKFDYVGVREKEGIEICKTLFNVDADSVMDPVFVVNKSIYYDLLSNCKLNKDNPFISAYILGATHCKMEILDLISKEYGKEVKIIENPNEPGQLMRNVSRNPVEQPSVEEWLWYIQNSDFFVGDSFHGLCFALIFNVPFLITVDSNISGMARFRTLLELVGLQERLFIVDKDDSSRIPKILKKKIDFDKVNKVLIENSINSKNWLKNAIDSDKTKTVSAEELMIKNLLKRVEELEKKIK